MPKVSIIVPIYNVESYIQRCIESLRSQTLLDIEIILVDSGSTDNSGKICDEYAAQDARIKVIHKQNEGVSCARNDGIAAATAPYIMFVDSDDWMAPDFCERPYHAAVSHDASLVIFRIFSVKNGRIRKSKKEIPTGVVDAETAVKYGGVVVWNKLYKRELFAKIRYPKGRVYEDLAVTHKLVFAADRIVILPDFLYYWVYRKGSITKSHSVKNNKDGFLAASQRAYDLRELGCAEELYLPVLWTFALGFLARAVPDDDPVFEQAGNVADSIDGIPSSLNWKQKLLLIVWKIDKRLFHFICRAFGRKEPGARH